MVKSGDVKKMVNELVPQVREAFGIDKGKKKGALGAVADFLDNLHKQSAPVQMGVGSGAGLVTGYIFTKGSKAVASLLGVSVIFFTFAEHRGYIKLNRTKFEKDVKDLTRKIERELYGKSAVESATDDVTSFMGDNAYLLGGFTAGCLLGYGFA